MVSLSINGTDRSDLLATASLSVEKNYGVELCRFFVSVADGLYEPAPNDEVVVYHDADLLFGGVALAIGQRQWLDHVGLAVAVEARDFSVLLDRIVVGRLTIPAETEALAAMFALFETHLEPKGFTWLSAESGGPELPADLVFDHQPLSAIFNEIATQAEGWWRVNGAKQVALVFAGELVGDPLVDADILEADIVGDDAIEQDAAVQANRLFIRTGGSGIVQHSEGRTGDGVQTRFHLNVEPRPPQDDPPVSYAPTQVVENGTPYTIGAGRWAYDADAHAAYIASGGPPTDGHTILIGPYEVEYPAWVRVWTADATNADGTWDVAALSDAIVQATDKTDIVQTAEWGRIVLAQRTDAAKVSRVSTYKPGYYPILRVYVDRPARGIEATYLVERVQAQVMDLDGDHEVLYQLDLIEGGHLGPSYRDAWLERRGNTAGGTSVLGGSVPAAVPPSGSGTPGPFVGYGIPLGGSNIQTVPLTTSWVDIGEANPMPHPADAAGTWTLRVYGYLLAAGTLQVRLLVGGVEVADVSTTDTGSYVDVSFYAEMTDTYAGPVALGQCLLQAKVASGTNTGVFGQAHTVKTA